MPIQPGEPVYFLSLEVENVGAFGPQKVRIDLSDSGGKPAKWTLILGENGTGKTTALECLFGLMPVSVENGVLKGPNMRALVWLANGKMRRLRRGGLDSHVLIDATVWNSLGAGPGLAVDQLTFALQPKSSIYPTGTYLAFSPFDEPDKNPGSITVCYRVARDVDGEDARLPEGVVAAWTGKPGETVKVTVPISVEEWLSELHHTKLARQEKDGNSVYDAVRDLLIDVLPASRVSNT